MNEKEITRKKIKEKEIIQKLKSIFSFAEKISGDIKNAYWKTLFRDIPDESEKAKQNLYPILSFAGIMILSCFIALSAFKGGIYPAGFALLSAIGNSEKGKLGKAGEKNTNYFNAVLNICVFSGVLFSCIFIEEKALTYVLTYIALFVIRGAVTDGKFNENIIARITFSAVFSVSCGLIMSAYDNFSLESLFAALSFVLITPVLCYLFCGFYLYSGGYIDADSGMKKIYLEMAAACSVFCFLHSINEARILGFSPSFVIAVISVFFIAKKYGALYGAVIGCVCGLAQSSVQAVPTLALAGFFSGLFFDYSCIMAFMISFITSCGYNLYSGALYSFGEITADFVIGMLISYPLMKTATAKKESNKLLCEKPLRREAEKLARKKLKNMSDAFSSLSEVFYTVSDSMKKPQYTETSRLVSDAFSKYCSMCDKSALCWGKEYSASVDMTAKISNKLMNDNKTEKSILGNAIISRCDKCDEIIESINSSFAKANGVFYKNNKTRLLAGEYSTVSKLIKNTATEIGRELEYNPDMESKAEKVLNSLKIPFLKVAVFGSREMKIDVYGVSIEKINANTDEIVEKFENEFACKFDSPSFVMLEENAIMRLKRKRKIALECAKSGCCKKGEVMNGDSSVFFETDRDYFYTLICDGMGSGREAAFTSRLASIFIEKLMCCASPKNVSFEMLNTFLMSKSDETFTTVDMLEIDLLSGNADFIKLGAAPSFVVRGDRIHKIESKTMPAGILDNICAEKTSIELKDGDYIIMTSDGVDSDESGEWILKFISGNDFCDAGEICEKIMEEAKENIDFSDDISVSVIRIVNEK